ncbi:hypothetical protein LguiA_016105 [Lonicera macranthoides]
MGFKVGSGVPIRFAGKSEHRGAIELIKPSSTPFSVTLAYKPHSKNSFNRFSSMPLEDFIKFISYFVSSSPLHTLALLMEHLINPNQGQGIPPNMEQGSSVGDAPNPFTEVRWIEILNSEGELARICLPPAPDIPTFKKKYQILDSVKIRALGPKKRACYYRPGEVYFYKVAFEHGLRFPIDDYVRELLVTMNLAPAQVSPIMWSCLIGTMLIFMAVSAKSHDISIKEFITLFQPKDSGGKNKGIFNCPSRLGSSKINFGLLDNIPNWKKRFFFVSWVDWEHALRYHSIHDLKRWFLEPDSISKSYAILLSFKEKKPELEKSSWIEDINDFFLKYNADIVAPGMPWRYGSNIDPHVLTVDDLSHLDVLLLSERNDPGLRASKVAKNGGSDQGNKGHAALKGVVAEGEVPPAGDLEENRVATLGDRVLVIAPLQQEGVPVLLKSSKTTEPKEAEPSAPTSALRLEYFCTWVGLMNSPIEGLRLFNPEKIALERIGGPEADAQNSAVVNTGGQESTTDREEDIIIVGSKAAPDQTFTSMGVGGYGPESSQQDGFAFFVKGFTLPPLSQAVLEQQQETICTKLSDLEKELKKLKGSQPAIRYQAVEEFCGAEDPLLKISDSFITGFYKCKELALQKPEELEDLEVPSEIDVTSELMIGRHATTD